MRARRASGAWLLLVFGTGAASAQGPEAAAAPSAEMLEFLGDWETADGQSIDPASFDDDTYAGLNDETDNHDSH